ncbi:MAG: Na/Pi cotransporter family protein [Phycisphaerae bacterium]|nr:Na/Pi cotransporter family protein [Phycisphaerae bacterium]
MDFYALILCKLPSFGFELKNPNGWYMALCVIGGLGIFLLGMKNMSEGMQAVAGDRLRKMISAVTNNRFMACGVGTGVTAIIQSSSITTVMVVGMVNAGIMTLIQAVGVILGANIGTTVTAWIMGLPIGKFGLPIVGLAAIAYLFTKNEKARYTAGVVLGLGLVFFGLQLMETGFYPLREMGHEWFKLSATTYLGAFKCIMFGALLTAIVQSSSATIGITLALAATGFINYQAAAALVLGENIGTTVTALLASIGAGTNAKRASYAHTIINLLGVCWIFLPFFAYTGLVKTTVSKVFNYDIPVQCMDGNLEAVNAHMTQWDLKNEEIENKLKDKGLSKTEIAELENQQKELARQNYKGWSNACIAATHTGFNVANAMFFMLFVPQIARFLQRIVPDKPVKEKKHLTYLDVRMLETPALGVQQSQNAIMDMSKDVVEMLNWLKKFINKDDSIKAEQLFTREEELDMAQKEIVEFVGHLMTGHVTFEVTDECRRQLRMADEYESISDYIATILKLNLKMRDNNMQLTSDGVIEINDLHDHVAKFIMFVNEAVKNGDIEIISEAKTAGQTITHLMKKYRNKHLERVSSGQTSPLQSLIHTDILNAYRRIKDHTFNIAEAQSGEK